MSLIKSHYSKITHTTSKREVAFIRELRCNGLNPQTGRQVTSPNLKGGRNQRVGLCIPDAIWTRKRIALFFDGCYWHSCPVHHNSARPARRDRDARVTAALTADGWRVLRVWEHEDTAEAVARVVAAVKGEGTP